MVPNAPEAPLAGRRVMVTRPEVESGGDAVAPDPLAELLASLGAEIVVQPAVRIGQPADWRPVQDALARLDQFDWIVFSSVHGVRFFWKHARKATQPGAAVLQTFTQPGAAVLHAKAAAVGPGTAEELARWGVKADCVPERHRAEDLAEALLPGATGRRFLLVRGSRGREVLAERLAAAGAKVEQVAVYASTDVDRPDPQVAALLAAGQIDWVTVTSSAIAQSLVRLFGRDLHRARLASISPLTSGVLRELGYEPAAEATKYTMSGLAEAILTFVKLSE